MPKSDRTLFLRRILFADGAISGATGLLMAFGAEPLGDLLGLPANLLRYAGWSLLPFALLVVWLSRREAPPRTAIVTVISLNATWVLASVLVLFPGWISPNALGYAFILGQACAVAALAELQVVGLRNTALAA